MPEIIAPRLADLFQDRPNGPERLPVARASETTCEEKRASMSARFRCVGNICPWLSASPLNRASHKKGSRITVAGSSASTRRRLQRAPLVWDADAAEAGQPVRGERERVSSLHRRCQYIDDEAEETDAEASEEEEETQADRDFIDDGDEDDGSAEEEAEDEENSSDAGSECRKEEPDGMGCDDAPSQVCTSLRDRFCEAFERLQWRRHDPSNWQELQYPRPITSTKAALPQHARKHDVMRRSPPEESVGRTQSPHWETAIVDEVDEEDEDETIFLPKSAIKPKSTAAKSKTRLLEECDEVDESGGREGQREKEQTGLDIPGWRETTTPRRRLQPVSSSSDDDVEKGKDLDVSVVAPRQKKGANKNYGAATDEVVSSDEQAISTITCMDHLKWSNRLNATVFIHSFKSFKSIKTINFGIFKIINFNIFLQKNQTNSFPNTTLNKITINFIFPYFF